MDAAGNEGGFNAAAQDLVFTIDSTLPIVPTITFTDADRTADITYVSGTTLVTRNFNAITVSGVGEPGARVVIFNDTNNNGKQDPGEVDLALFAPDGTTALANSARVVATNGTYRFDLRGLANGEYNLRILTIDPAGNIRKSEGALSFEVDRVVLPVQRMELAPNAAVANNDTGRSPYDAVTNTTTPVFRVWLPRDAFVNDRIRINRASTATGAEIGLGVVTAQDITKGYIDIQVSGPLADASYSGATAITAFYIDRAGNTSAGIALNQNLVIDSVVPEAPAAGVRPTMISVDDTGFSSTDDITRRNTNITFGPTVGGTGLPSGTVALEVVRVVGQVIHSLGFADLSSPTNWRFTYR